MLCGEPLHVQHCSSSLFGGEMVLAQGPNCATLPEERAVWNYCLVRSNPLELRFFQFRDGQSGETKTSVKKNTAISGSSFFTLACLNSDEICRKGGEKYEVFSSLQSSMVTDCVMSCRTRYPHVSGSMMVHAVELLEKHQKKEDCKSSKEGAQRRLKKDFVVDNRQWLAHLSLALGLPSVVLLLRFGPGGNRRAVLFLRPHVHAGKHANIAYWASLVMVSDLSRQLAVSPSGDRVVVAPDHFDTVEDPLYASDPSAVVLTGQWITIDSSVAGPSATVLHVLAGDLVGGHRGMRRISRVLGSALMWVQCREIPGAMREVEIVLGSHRGNLLVCTRGAIPGTAAQGYLFHCRRCFVAATSREKAEGMCWETGPTLALANISCAYAQSEGALYPLLQGIPATAQSLMSSPGPFACPTSENVRSPRVHVPRQRVRGCSGDGLVWICVPDGVSEVTQVTAVLSCAAATPEDDPLRAPEEGVGEGGHPTSFYDEEDGDCRVCCILPKGIAMHDVFVVYHPRITGFLVAGVTQNTKSVSSSLSHQTSSLTSDEAECWPNCPLQLFFMVFGSEIGLPVTMKSFRQWRLLPRGFFAKPHSVRLLSVDVVDDPAGSESLLVALGSSGAAHVVATALVSLPRIEHQVLNELSKPDGAVHLSMLVATHVAQSVVRLQEHAEWRERQQPSQFGSEFHARSGVSPGTALLPSEVGSKPFETLLSNTFTHTKQVCSPAHSSRTAVAECMMELMLRSHPESGDGQEAEVKCLQFGVLQPLSQAGLCEMEEEIVKVLRVQLLEMRRTCGDANPCLRSLCGVFAGVQRGLERAGIIGDKVVRHYLRYFRALSGVLQSAMDVLVMSGSLTGIFIAASTLLQSHQREMARTGNGGMKDTTSSRAMGTDICWWDLLQPVFDAAFIATRGAPMGIPSLLLHCSPVTQAMARMEKKMFFKKPTTLRGTSTQKHYPLIAATKKDDEVKDLDEVSRCVAAGPAQWSTLSEEDLCRAARRLFLVKGARDALQLLHPICATKAGTVRVQELYEMYTKIQDKSNTIRIAHYGGTASG